MASGRVSKVKGKVVDIPNAPTIGTATAGGGSVSITFTATEKGGPTRSYIAKSNPGNITATGSTSPISVTGLTAGTSYTISVAGVNETGTSEYSSASGSAVPTETTSYESIATVTLGSAQSSLTFNSFSGYTHLQVRSLARQTLGTVSYMFMRFNSDSGSNYSYHTVYGNGASAAVDYSSTTYGVAGIQGGTANIFAASVLDILDYSNTNKFKTTRVLDGVDVNGSGGYVELTSSCWRSTSAITSIEIFLSGANFDTGSKFALYGIKA